MYSSNFQLNASSRLSEESQQSSTPESFIDHLRDRGLQTESLQFADVSVYIDPNGNRYRIQRLEPSAQSTQPRTLLTPTSTPSRDPSADIRCITDEARFAAGLTDPFPSPTLQLQRDVTLPPHIRVRRRPLADSSIASNTSDGHLRVAQLPTSEDLRCHPGSDKQFNLDAGQNTSRIGTPRHQLWQSFGNDAPISNCPPRYPEIGPYFARDHRMSFSQASATSPTSVSGATQSNFNIPHIMTNGFDLRTPVVVHHSETSTMSEESIPVETETPGERLLLDTNVAISMSPQSDFIGSSMRVFFNSATDDIRFYIESESQGSRTAQSFRVQRSNAEFVPIYGYSPSHIRVVCIKEILHRRKKLTRAHAKPPPAEEGGISIFCEFYTMQALFKFQKQLLDEEIFLDIERARCMRLFEDSRHTRQIDAPRIQIWRESRCDKTAFDDNMSHYTAGTMLSGPMKDRVAPIMSRLVVYLGRSEEYMTVFITDDITIQKKGMAKIVFTATKLGLLKARGGIQCYHAPRTSTAAGIKLDKAGIHYEEQNRFGSYKSFEIEFENAQNRFAFVETWDKMLQARRRERVRLKAIQDEVSNDVYTGRMARRVIM